MIEYVYGEDAELVPWAEIHTSPEHRFRPDAKAIGMRVDGQLRAVAIYDNFSLNDCLFGIASDGSRRWVTREYCRRVMAYPFIQCDFSRITCIVSRHNKPSLALTKRFGGWQLEGVLREAGTKGEDLLVFGMLRRDCLWLPKRQPMPAAELAV
jgi:hypothetical protein